jgi:hypothetical protein
VKKEHCWAITEMVGRPCYGSSVSSASEFVCILLFLVYVFIGDGMYIKLQTAKIRFATDLPKRHCCVSPVVSEICTANVPQMLYKFYTCFENGKNFTGN